MLLNAQFSLFEGLTLRAIIFTFGLIKHDKCCSTNRKDQSSEFTTSSLLPHGGVRSVVSLAATGSILCGLINADGALLGDTEDDDVKKINYYALA